MSTAPQPAQAGASTDPVLVVEGVQVAYGGLVVLKDLALSVGPGEVLGLVGPNGAGKSTAINVISGLIRPQHGRVVFAGRQVDRLRPPSRARLGMARTFQNLELFGSMSVFDNVLCGAEAGAPGRRFSGGRGAPARRHEAVGEVLALIGLESLSAAPVGSLPYGTKKLVELARVFVRRPPFVLLDEPVAGLNREEKAEFVQLFARLRSTYRLAGLLVEHDMTTVEATCERVIVLDSGIRLAEGPVRETLRRPEVIEAYLGPTAIGGSQ